jgi:hypothetical protein
MNKAGLLIFFILFLNPLFGDSFSKIDWINGKIYSSIKIRVKNDEYFASNRLTEIEMAREKAKLNYYSILKEINIYESISVLDYIENTGIKSRDLFTLIDQSFLKMIDYPDLNSIMVTYYINIYGDRSLISILMSEREAFTEDLKSYMDYTYKTDYSGVIIDARGRLNSFDGNTVKVKPCIFITVKDNEGQMVFNQYNVYPENIKNKGMVRYSYDIHEDLSDRVGKKPHRIVAYGTGDRSGSILVISLLDAKKILSSEKTRDAIKNGNIAVIIDR